VNSVCIVHNEYQHPGGEDEVVRAEAALLRGRGHGVHLYQAHNDSVNQMGKFGLLKSTIWNGGSGRAIADALASSGSEIAHFHNIVPLISPAAYCAARRQGVAVVQTLHNYRLLCPNATFFRDGGVCEECLGRAVPWPGVVHACYRGSRAATGAVASMLTLHRAIGTWSRMVDVYIALTEFARRKFIAGGLPADKIVVKPNFVEDPGAGRHSSRNVLFVGRFAPEKGVETMLEAWRLFAVRHPDVRLQIVGGTPQTDEHRRNLAGVEWFGWQPREQALRLMKEARLLIFPSIHYEGFPMTLVEAMATGLPVIASRLGGVAEIVRDGHSGWLFGPHDPEDLCRRLHDAFSDDDQLDRMGRNARLEYVENYMPDRNYSQLMGIYDLALQRARVTTTTLDLETRRAAERL